MELKTLRKAKKTTQRQVAKELGIHPMTYNNWERGLCEPDLKSLIKLADYFDVTLDYLVGREFANDLGYLTDEQRQFVRAFLRLNEYDQAKALGFVMGLEPEQ